MSVTEADVKERLVSNENRETNECPDPLSDIFSIMNIGSLFFDATMNAQLLIDDFQRTTPTSPVRPNGDCNDLRTRV
jgi:hypothetical protein